MASKAPRFIIRDRERKRWYTGQGHAIFPLPLFDPRRTKALRYTDHHMAQIAADEVNKLEGVKVVVEKL